MTNPNFLNFGLARFQNKVSAKLTTVFKPIIYNPVNSNQILRLENFVARNTTANAVTIDVELVRNTVGYSISREIEIPAFSAMVLVDKDFTLYLEETDAIRARINTDDAAHISVNFTEIGETDSSDVYTLGENFHPASLDIFDWSGTVSQNATITRDTSTGKSPFGGIPLKMAQTGDDAHIITYNTSQWNIAPASSGQTWQVRVWAKASTPTTGQIFIFGAREDGGFVSPGGIGATTISIGTEWAEFSYEYTPVNPDAFQTIAYIQTRLDGTQTGGAGIDIWWDNLQVYRIS